MEKVQWILCAQVVAFARLLPQRLKKHFLKFFLRSVCRHLNYHFFGLLKAYCVLFETLIYWKGFFFHPSSLCSKLLKVLINCHMVQSSVYLVEQSLLYTYVPTWKISFIAKNSSKPDAYQINNNEKILLCYCHHSGSNYLLSDINILLYCF